MRQPPEGLVVPEGFVWCEDPSHPTGWHHPNYHEPFRWSRRARFIGAWWATKTALRAWGRVIRDV